MVFEWISTCQIWTIMDNDFNINGTLGHCLCHFLLFFLLFQPTKVIKYHKISSTYPQLISSSTHLLITNLKLLFCNKIKTYRGLCRCWSSLPIIGLVSIECGAVSYAVHRTGGGGEEEAGSTPVCYEWHLHYKRPQRPQKSEYHHADCSTNKALHQNKLYSFS